METASWRETLPCSEMVSSTTAERIDWTYGFGFHDEKSLKSDAERSNVTKPEMMKVTDFANCGDLRTARLDTFNCQAKPPGYLGGKVSGDSSKSGQSIVPTELFGWINRFTIKFGIG